MSIFGRASARTNHSRLKTLPAVAFDLPVTAEQPFPFNKRQGQQIGEVLRIRSKQLLIVVNVRGNERHAFYKMLALGVFANLFRQSVIDNRIVVLKLLRRSAHFN
jgi:hypothetical protein